MIWPVKKVKLCFIKHCVSIKKMHTNNVFIQTTESGYLDWSKAHRMTSFKFVVKTSLQVLVFKVVYCTIQM